MSFLNRIWLRVDPTMEATELASPIGPGTLESRAAATAEKTAGGSPPEASLKMKWDGAGQLPPDRVDPVSERSIVMRWLLNDILYIAMLLLAIVGVIFRLPVSYWIVLTPIFGVISVVEGWSHFPTRGERVGLTFRVAAIWCAVLVSVYLLYNSGVQGVLNANATSLVMITLLALGTFVAGVQARVWQICTVGGLLFLSVPGVGWLDQSPLLLVGFAFLAVVIGGVAWWATRWQSAPPMTADVTQVQKAA